MVDNIKFNKILPPLSPARKVARTDSRGRHSQGTPFKESLEQKQKKKKKENPANPKQPESEISLKILPSKRQAGGQLGDRRDHPSKSVRSRLIDIRV
jgi:hypothetical protein